MEFVKFTEKLQRGISDFLGDGYSVEVNRVTKNNGVVLSGLTIMEKNSNVSPTIYLESFYEEYESGKSLGEVVKEVLHIYEENRIDGKVDLEFLTDYGKVRKKIVYKLICYDENRRLLERVPHVRFLDLALVFYCRMIHEIFGQITILIQNSQCELWNITDQDLYRQALENTPYLLKAQIRNIRSMIGRELEEEIERERGDSMDRREDMYVLTNERQTYGAACILYPGVLETFAKEKDSNLYILPSSVHEVILVPGSNLYLAEQFRKMVREVNDTQVDREEVLSDFVYYYDREEGEIIRL